MAWRPVACLAIAASVLGPAALGQARAEQTRAIPFTAERWRADGAVAFEHVEGFPNGRLSLGEGSAALKDMVFADGTVEYDAKLEADGFAAIRFRVAGPQSAEILYLRPDTDCPAANDCVQYVPKVHGVWPWEMYPEYQAAAPVRVGAWNHVKLVISGRRMKVFINGAASPTLSVGELEGDAAQGGLELAGPGEFANLTVAPGATEGLAPTPSADPTAGDGRLVRHWRVSPPATLAYGVAPTLAQMPGDPASWRSIASERGGLVNLSRLYGSPSGPSTGSVAWLTTGIESDRDRLEHVSFGFLHEAWVFVNGRAVFSGENLYYPDTKRLAPDGRISLGNSTFALPLRKGRNQVAVALNNILGVGHVHYGWGLEMRLDDLDGVALLGSDAAGSAP